MEENTRYENPYYIKLLGVVPNLEEWLAAVNNLIDNFSFKDKEIFLISLDTLVTLYQNGTYFEVDDENEYRVKKIRNKLITIANSQIFTEEEREDIINGYAYSIRDYHN